MLRKGKRDSEKLNNKKAKKHVKEFYKILGEMDDVAKSIITNKKVKDVTEDTIVEIASKYTNRTIGNMEKMILLSKLKVTTD